MSLPVDLFYPMMSSKLFVTKLEKSLLIEKKVCKQSHRINLIHKKKKNNKQTKNCKAFPERIYECSTSRDRAGRLSCHQNRSIM